MVIKFIDISGLLPHAQRGYFLSSQHQLLLIRKVALVIYIKTLSQRNSINNLFIVFPIPTLVENKHRGIWYTVMCMFSPVRAKCMYCNHTSAALYDENVSLLNVDSRIWRCIWNKSTTQWIKQNKWFSMRLELDSPHAFTSHTHLIHHKFLPFAYM